MPGGKSQRRLLKAAPADSSVLFLSHDHNISILPLVVKNPGFATFVNLLAVSGGTPARSVNENVAWALS